MKRRTFSLREIMLVVVIIGASIELGENADKGRTPLWEAVAL